MIQKLKLMLQQSNRLVLRASMYKKLLLFLLIIFISWNFNNCLAKTVKLKPPKLARLAVENYLNDKKLNNNNLALSESVRKKPIGVFVTILDKNNRSKGCWGRLYPQSSLKESIITAAIDAATKDYRVRPLQKSELTTVKFQVSMVTQIIPVSTTNSINPYQDGIMVQSGTRTGIILPGEAVDAHYQMVMAKLKAGINPKQKCNLFKLTTKIYKEV